LVAGIAIALAGVPVAAQARPAPTAVKLQTQPVLLSLDRGGVYHITGSWLAARGVSWSGMLGKDLAVTFEGKPVARLVSTSGPLTSGAYVEFFAPAVSTMYTSRAVYVLSSKLSLARGVATINAGAGHGKTRSYAASVAVGPKKNCATQNGGCLYEPMAPGDKWFYNEIIANGGSSDLKAKVAVDHQVRSGRARLSLDVWGVTDFGGAFPQHVIRAFLNGHRILQIAFSGSNEQVRSATFPQKWLVSGSNTVRLVLPGTVKNQYDLDIIDIRGFSLAYGRTPIAVHGALTANFPEERTATVSGFHSSNIRVWQLGASGAALVRGTHVSGAGRSHSVSFVAPAAGDYLAVDNAGWLTPTAVTPLPSTSYLLKGKAKLLVVAPRSFWPALYPLVAYHDSHGVPVKLADIGDVFDRFTAGMFDATAIRDYIQQAESQLGITAVLLVGADTYDYHHYIDCAHGGCPSNPQDVSLVPSLYTMDSFYGQIPSDELLVDNSSGAPSIAIGRIPAVTASEVKTIVNRTVSMMRHPSGKRSAVMVAGTGDPSFDTSSDALAAELPAGYGVTKLNEPATSNGAARSGLLKAIQSGVTIANFVGHGNLEQWDQNPVLSIGDVPRLHPNPSGQLYFGWGCQTAYDVDPTDRALNARLLFGGGAALTLGSTGLDLAQPQSELAVTFYHELFHDSSAVSVGQALERAEVSVSAADPGALDPIRSYEIFGDPMLPLTLLQ
jgi:hypothetical protein